MTSLCSSYNPVHGIASFKTPVWIVHSSFFACNMVLGKANPSFRFLGKVRCRHHGTHTVVVARSDYEPGISEVKPSDTGRGCREQAGQTQKCLYTMILPVYARYSEIYEEVGRHANPLTLHERWSPCVLRKAKMVFLGLKSSY
jgi:hypothetical protein